MYTAYLVEMKWLTAQEEVHLVSLCKGFNSAPSYYRPVSETWMSISFPLIPSLGSDQATPLPPLDGP
ncbi:hypothetical protein E2C01_095408 [Portunus trituberculatus]|uniref:Uncharacterized protein n=1 Tax=Portunus trituberculatus TaxID=210409 RepID=A0A5B7JPR6_PORTR|nr:hypothetical protein [Portunus trituberculatus]